jgi:predicted ATPase
VGEDDGLGQRPGDHRPDVAAALRRRARQRAFGPGPFLLGARIRWTPGAAPLPRSYPFLPIIHDLDRLDLAQAVTVITGENGVGKSTLIEAIAIANGFAAQGGPLADKPGAASRQERVLADEIELQTGPHRPRAGFFLRSESFVNVASSIDATDLEDLYGRRSLDELSHGESVLALATIRLGSDGLFIFDEPEAALSVTSQLAFIALIQQAVVSGSQFILATHSPILISYPGAAIYEASESGLEAVEAAETDPVALTQGFLAAPETFLRHLNPSREG